MHNPQGRNINVKLQQTDHITYTIDIQEHNPEI